MDILSFEKLESGKFTNVESMKRIYLKDLGIENVDDITSVASHPTEDLIALSVVSDPKTDPGYVVLLTKDGELLIKFKLGHYLIWLPSHQMEKSCYQPMKANQMTIIVWIQKEQFPLLIYQDGIRKFNSSNINL